MRRFSIAEGALVFAANSRSLDCASARVATEATRKKEADTPLGMTTL